MGTKSTKWVFLILFAGVVGCSSNPTNFEDSESEILGLQWIEAFRKGGSSTELLDLGSMGSGRNYYFMVTNAGNRPIHNVRVASEEPEGFTISPQRIARVDPGPRTGVEPMVRVSIQHGRTPDGEHVVPLLKQGDHELTLSLEGDLLDARGNVLETVQFEARIQVKVLVSAVTISDRSRVINLHNWNGKLVAGGFEAYERVRSFDVTDELVVDNTGNTPVEVKFFPNFDRNGPGALNVSLAPGESVVIPDDISGWLRFAFSEASRDESIFPPFPNGYTYLHMDRNED